MPPAQECPPPDIDALLTWTRLVRTYHRLQRGVQSALAPHGLSLPQYEALYFIGADPGLTQQELAVRLLITKSNASALVDRLVRDGYAERHADGQDRRVRRLRLTAHGSATLGAAIPAHHATVSRLLAPLPGPDRAALRGTLDILEAALPPE